MWGDTVTDNAVQWQDQLGDLERPPWPDPRHRRQPPSLPEQWPTWWYGVALACVVIVAAHVLGARLLGEAAAVAADVVAVAALGALALVLWRWRTAARSWTVHVHDLTRQVHRLQEQARQIDRQWREYHHQLVRDQAEEQESGRRLDRIDEHVQAILECVDLLVRSQAPGSGDLEREVLVSIGRRLHALIGRALEAVTAVERQVEDPDLLHEIFRLDHLLILLRRAAERLAVLGGETARKVTRPVPLATVLRQAVAEVEQYRRVNVPVPPADVALPGHAGPDVIHLLAELVENATRFSPPTTQVVMRTVPGAAETAAGAGLVIEIQDRGLPIPGEKLATLNRLLASPEEADVRGLLRRGQIGLPVAAQLARRHGIHVQLRPQGGGTQARVVVPGTLLLPADQAAQSRLAPAPELGTKAAPLAASASASAAATAQPPSGAPTPLPRRRGNAQPTPSPAAHLPGPGRGAHPPAAHLTAAQADAATGPAAERADGNPAAGAAPSPDGKPPLLRRSDTRPEAAPPAHRSFDRPFEHPDSASQRAAGPAGAANPGLMASYTDGIRQAARDIAADTPRPASSSD
mgnify:CR=1 FL=1